MDELTIRENLRVLATQVHDFIHPDLGSGPGRWFYAHLGSGSQTRPLGSRILMPGPKDLIIYAHHRS
jgi:hypothetical protein